MVLGAEKEIKEKGKSWRETYLRREEEEVAGNYADIDGRRKCLSIVEEQEKRQKCKIMED